MSDTTPATGLNVSPHRGGCGKRILAVALLLIGTNLVTYTCTHYMTIDSVWERSSADVARLLERAKVPDELREEVERCQQHAICGGIRPSASYRPVAPYAMIGAVLVGAGALLLLRTRRPDGACP